MTASIRPSSMNWSAMAGLLSAGEIADDQGRTMIGQVNQRCRAVGVAGVDDHRGDLRRAGRWRRLGPRPWAEPVLRMGAMKAPFRSDG
jgi:hypothetical protein